MTANLGLKCELVTAQTTKENIAAKQDDHVIIESNAESNTCLEPTEDNPAPRLVVSCKYSIAKFIVYLHLAH